MTTAYLSDSVFTGDGNCFSPGLVVVHQSGMIKYVGSPEGNTVYPKERKKLVGTLVPGFVNAHTHLELSWMKGRVPKGKGLDGFIRKVVGIREDIPSLASRRKAMDNAIREMIRWGTIAAADIANGLTSLPVKMQSEIDWYTFVEVFGSEEKRADHFFRRGMSIYEAFIEVGKASLVPHATYSVSKSLYDKIFKETSTKRGIISIHHQENPDENEYFLKGTGKVVERLKDLGMDRPEWIPTGKRPLASILPMMKGIRRLLLVHNTYATAEDVALAAGADFPLSWVLCPEANLYIENKLPDIEMLREKGVSIALGTDSLASGKSLSILKQMSIIQKAFPAIPFAELIQWGSWNGAIALGMENKLGRLAPGTIPGLLLLENLEGDTIGRATKVRRLA